MAKRSIQFNLIDEFIFAQFEEQIIYLNSDKSSWFKIKLLANEDG